MASLAGYRVVCASLVGVVAFLGKVAEGAERRVLPCELEVFVSCGQANRADED